jgi:hypothetical protein
LFLFEIAFAFARASALLEAPHACKDLRSLVGLPSFFSGPGIFPILAKKEARLGLSPFLTGGFKFDPGFSRSYDFRPLSFNPPLGFLPAFFCQSLITFYKILLKKIKSYYLDFDNLYMERFICYLFGLGLILGMYLGDGLSRIESVFLISLIFIMAILE